MKDFHRSLPMMLYRTLDQVMPRFRRIFAQYELTEQQWRILRVLWDEDALSMQHLASATLISPPSLVGVIDRMVNAGLVEKRASQTDRRRVHVLLTAHGRELEREVSPAVQAAYEQLEGALSSSQWQALYSGLDTLSKPVKTTETNT